MTVNDGSHTQAAIGNIPALHSRLYREYDNPMKKLI